MRQLPKMLWLRFSEWDRPSRIAFVLAVLLLLLVAVLLAFGPVGLRQPAFIGFIGLMFIAQLVFMWANRHMITPYTRAQRLYLDEDFSGACEILETVREAGKASVRDLTLLGNAYRQRNMLDESGAALREALALNPNHYFPLYGFGRTLLIQGHYEDAATALQQSLDAGAPQGVQLDLGEALYRSGQGHEALAVLKAVMPQLDEPHRVLMGWYLLNCLGEEHPVEKPGLVSGLVYWQAHAERYDQSPYGRTLLGDVQKMQVMLEEA